MQRVIRPRENVTEVVVRAVAEQTDTEPTVLQPLGDLIDPDAIEALFDGASGRGDRSLRLEYGGCRVTIDRETVTVEDAPRPLE